jgi:hypothetical protein
VATSLLAETEVAANAKMAAKAKNGTHGLFLRMVSLEHLVALSFTATLQLYRLVSISSSC